jgi:hypothetical protein
VQGEGEGQGERRGGGAGGGGVVGGEGGGEFPEMYENWFYSTRPQINAITGTGWSWLRIGTGDGHLWVR